MKQNQSFSAMPIYVGIALGYFGNYIYMPHLVSFVGSRYSGTLAGFIIFMTFLGRLLASVVSGGVAKRYGRKPVLVVTVLIEAFALLGYGFSQSIVVLSVLATIVGIASGISFPALKASLTEVPEGDGRKKAFAHFILAQKIGTIAGALVGVMFMDTDLRGIYSAVFIIFVGYAISVGKFLHLTSQSALPQRTAAVLTWVHPSKWEIWNTFGYFMTYTLFWFLYSQFLIGMPLHIQWLESTLPVTTPFWITGISMLLLQLFLYQRMSRKLSESQLMVAGLGAFLLCFFFLGVGKSAAWIVTASVAFVIAELLFIPAFDMWLSSAVPQDEIGKAMGTQHFFRSLGNMFGTLCGGMAFDLSRTAGYPGLNWIIFAGIASCCMLYIFKQNQRSLSMITPQTPQSSSP